MHGTNTESLSPGSLPPLPEILSTTLRSLARVKHNTIQPGWCAFPIIIVSLSFPVPEDHSVKDNWETHRRDKEGG